MSVDAVYGAGVMRQGRLRLLHAERLAAHLTRLRDGAVEIAIRRRYATRSHEQNRFYWGVLVDALSEATGYTPPEIHALCKAKFLPKRLAVQDRNGRLAGEFVLGGTTRSLTVGEFGDYCRAIESWMTEDLGFTLPTGAERSA